MLFLQSAVVLRFSADARAVGRILPAEVVSIGGVTFARDRIYLAAAAAIIGVVLWAVFRFTRYGLATRAGAENEVALGLTGYSPNMLAAGAWVLSAASTGLMAILAAPSIGLNPTRLTLLVVPALAVALLARLSSLAVACAGGLTLGALQSELSYLSSRDWWPAWAQVGLTDAIPFAVIVLALFVVGRGLPERGALVSEPLPTVLRSANDPRKIAIGIGAGVAALALTSGSYRFGVITSMIVAVIALSFVVLTGLVGQISLAQAAIAGSAGFALSRLGTDIGLPFPLSLIASALVATALGVLVGIPALRIRGAQLAVVTLAGAVAVEQFLFRNPNFTTQGGNPIDDAELFGIDLGVRSSTELTRLPFGLLVLAVLVLCAVAVGNLTRSDTGRALVAVRGNERAAASAGVNVAATKLIAFGVASFLAGVGGCLLGYSRGQLSADSFGVFVGLSLLAAAYLGGITSVTGALIGGMFAPLGLGYVFMERNVHIGEYYPLLSAVALDLHSYREPERHRREGPRGSASARTTKRKLRVSAAAPAPGAIAEVNGAH